MGLISILLVYREAGGLGGWGRGGHGKQSSPLLEQHVLNDVTGLRGLPGAGPGATMKSRGNG